jgi:riboflavin synthase
VFTGIVEEMGRVAALERSAGSARLVVTCRVAAGDIAHGASIAVNGVCLTVTGWQPDPDDGAATQVSFDVMQESLDRSSLGDLAVGSAVNLERAVRVGDRLGGHLVQGHVDGVGTVAGLTRQAETARLTIEWPGEALAPLLIPQGSVAVDGVSLTVARLGEREFEIMIIPHTLAATTLGALTPGKRVNLEMDMIGKYVQRILQLREPPAPTEGPAAREGTR